MILLSLLFTILLSLCLLYYYYYIYYSIVVLIILLLSYVFNCNCIYYIYCIIAIIFI